MGDITRVMAQHEQLHPQQIADLEARLVRLYKETIKQDELRTQMKRELEEKKGTIEQLHEQRQSANARVDELYARSIKQEDRVVILQASNDKLRERNALATFQEKKLQQQIQDLETLLTEPGRKHDVVVADDNHALDAIHQAVASHDEPAD